jgi:hypothetical protein
MSGLTQGIHYVLRISKKKWRGDADLAINCGAGILGRLDPGTEHERRFGIYLNMERGQAWQSMAIAQGIGLVFGKPGEDYFRQLYENEATVAKAVSASKRKGK